MKYNVISLAQFRSGYANDALKARDVLITFDDGEYSVYQNALPLLKKYNYPAVLFVITDLIGTSKPFWWDEILHHTKSMDEVRRAKKISNEERLHLIEKLRLGRKEAPFNQQQLTLAELQEMEQARIAIANHTATHPMLDKVSSKELADELSASVQFLKHHGFVHHDVMAYPNGNISDEALESLKKGGISLGMLFDHAVNKSTREPLKISRLSVNDHTPIWKFWLIVSDIHPRLLKLKKRFRK